MISIREWFIKNGKRPIIVTLLLIVLLILFYNILAYKELRERQLKSVNNLSSLISVGLAQKNRTLLESMLNNTHWQLNSKIAILCHGSETILMSGQSSDPNICSKLPGYIFDRTISKVIPGFDGFSIRINLPRFPEMHTTIFLGLIGLWIMTMCLFLVVRVQKLFLRDIIDPLSEGLESNFTNLSKALSILELEKIRLSLRDATQLKIDRAVNAAIVETSLQVSHDMRAPLAALNVITSNVSSIDSDTKTLLKQAVHRIQKISEDLLSQKRNSLSASTDIRTHKVADCIKSVTTQLQIDIGDRAFLEVKFDDDALEVGAIFQPDKLLRILSNLIGNSVDAAASRIKINISIEEMKLQVSVKDNGRGISLKDLPQIGEQGFTSGKDSGNGLGVSDAKATTESWGGTFRIESTVNQGTIVKMLFLISSQSPKLSPLISIASDGLTSK